MIKIYNLNKNNPIPVIANARIYINWWRNFYGKYEFEFRFHIGRIDLLLYIGDGTFLNPKNLEDN